jgi:hypothetical protein
MAYILTRPPVLYESDRKLHLRAIFLMSHSAFPRINNCMGFLRSHVDKTSRRLLRGQSAALSVLSIAAEKMGFPGVGLCCDKDYLHSMA